MAFQFSLAAVLRYRQSREEQERLRLQTLHTRRAALLRDIQQTREARAHLQSSMQQRLQQALTPAIEVQFCTASCDGLDRRQQQLQMSLQQLQGEIAAQAHRYKEERQKREVLESLRDLRLSEYRLLQQRREQAALDELFLLRRNFRENGCLFRHP